MSISRRNFIKSATAAAAAPFILPSGILSAEVKPNDKIVMGFIGMGKQNGGLMRNFINQKEIEVVAVCDVDTTRRNHAQEQVNTFYTSNADRGNPNCAAYVDYREITRRRDIDAVCIATPDHWHAGPTIDAMEWAKDVYCEKPLTHNIHESVSVIEATERHNRVLQTGSMQRSSREFRIACELVQNGAIGKISHVECSFGDPGRACDLPAEEPEPGLDWNFWCGPGPMRPYHSELSPRGLHDHFPNWRNYKEYGGGMVCDWGAHHLDIAQWGLGMDNSGPVKITPPESEGGKRGAKLHYKNGITVEHKDGFGVHFFGDEGEVKVNRGRFEVWRGGKKVAGFVDREDGSLRTELDKAEEALLQNAKIKLYESTNHTRDFIDAVINRTKPITNEIVGGRTAICCHLMNQAYYNHATIDWKPKRMTFKRGTGDPAWLTREYRSPWSV